MALHIFWALLCFLSVHFSHGSDIRQAHKPSSPVSASEAVISQALFGDLEELSRIVDIAYCVGLTGTGIQQPFTCASRCQDFEHFELVTTWNTGQLLSDSCGYIALSHSPSQPRIIVAFRGTYSIANTIIDLSTIPQEYVPYPGGQDQEQADNVQGFPDSSYATANECANCTVHLGFMKSWQHTKPVVLPHIEALVHKFPEYKLILVGHSLGGAVAALAGLDFEVRGWRPTVTTFGEPRIGNDRLVQYLDTAFEIGRNAPSDNSRYRRVTHIDDPVPLLPLTEWGYRPHGGEIYISKPALSPDTKDIHACIGDMDPSCIAGAESGRISQVRLDFDPTMDLEGFRKWWKEGRKALTIPPRWRIWQLFFAHRDYFWRLGLCIPGGDPSDWYARPMPSDGHAVQVEDELDLEL